MPPGRSTLVARAGLGRAIWNGGGWKLARVLPARNPGGATGGPGAVGGRDGALGMLVGTTVLTMPAAVEPVVWCSGIFDVMVTTFVLLSLLAARRYETEGVKPRITLFTWIVAALLTKETAVVAPLLILLDAWSRQVQTRRLYKDLSLLLVATTVIGVLRLFRASEAVRQPITKYMVQRWAFGTIGGLAVPWHVAFIRQYAVISALVVVALLGLITCLSAATVDSHARRVAISTATWPLICTAPALTFFYVSADLQNSRYLYLATIGWAGFGNSCLGQRMSNRAGEDERHE